LRIALLELAERDLARARLARIEQVAIERLSGFCGRARAASAPRRAPQRLVIRASQAATTEVVSGTSRPAPAEILDGLTDMICRYLLEDES
jgi:hypothetical protein